jgi:hypothetical protein
MMNCKEYRSVASDYVDHILDEVVAARYETHLAACSDCHTHLDQTRKVSLVMRHSQRPQTPRELRANVVTAVQRMAAGRLPLHQQVGEWLSKLNPHLVSYSTGVLASALLFAGTLAGLRPSPLLDQPSPEMIALARGGDRLESRILDVVCGTDSEYHLYNGLPPVLPAEPDKHGYELPRFRENGPMTSLAFTGWPKTGNESNAMLVEIGSDGCGRIIDVLTKPKDPFLLREMDWSLSRRSFQPAKKTDSGQPIPTRIVLVNYKVDVTG